VQPKLGVAAQDSEPALPRFAARRERVDLRAGLEADFSLGVSAVVVAALAIFVN
jgi:hypothetical protein